MAIKVELSQVLDLLEQWEQDALNAAAGEDARKLPSAANWLRAQANAYQTARHRLQKRFQLSGYQDEPPGDD